MPLKNKTSSEKPKKLHISHIPKFWSILLGHLIKHTHLISEESDCIGINYIHILFIVTEYFEAFYWGGIWDIHGLVRRLQTQLIFDRTIGNSKTKVGVFMMVTNTNSILSWSYWLTFYRFKRIYICCNISSNKKSWIIKYKVLTNFALIQSIFVRSDFNDFLTEHVFYLELNDGILNTSALFEIGDILN